MKTDTIYQMHVSADTLPSGWSSVSLTCACTHCMVTEIGANPDKVGQAVGITSKVTTPLNHISIMPAQRKVNPGRQAAKATTNIPASQPDEGQGCGSHAHRCYGRELRIIAGILPG